MNEDYLVKVLSGQYAIALHLVVLPIQLLIIHKPMAETQNLFKQVEEASFNVFEHVSCNSLGIDSQGKLAE